MAAVKLLLAALVPAAALLQVSKTLGDFCVLQRDAVDPPAMLWGFGAAGATISVTMDKKGLPPAIVGADGIWRAPLPPTPADIGGGAGHMFALSSSDGSTASLSHVLFGEVWSCGGQSNMSFDVSQCNNATAEIAAAEAYSSVFRIMTVGGQDNTPSSPAVDLNATAQPWEALSSATAGDFSAVCWFAARDAYDSLVAAGAGAIPFGLISNNVGGTSIELWSRGSDLATCANTSAAPYGPPYSNGVLFNGMVAPFTTGPTAMAVWLFYQAEANCPPYQFAPSWYACTFPALIQAWRAEQRAPSLPFLFVQLAPFNGTDGWEDIREAQLAALSLPAVAFGTMIDNGDPTSPYGTYHPRNKQLIGARLAQAALDVVYGLPVQWRSPELGSAMFSQTGSVVTVTATFLPGTLSPRGLAMGTAVCPTNETIPSSYCSDFSLFFTPAPAPIYAYLGAGYLAAGDDVGTGNLTVAQAQDACNAIPACMGFTFQSSSADPPSPVTVLFKSVLNFGAATGWYSYGSDRDVRGQRVSAAGAIGPDGRTMTMVATGAPGQTAAGAGYAWATWPLTPLSDAGTGLPVLPWYAVP